MTAEGAADSGAGGGGRGGEGGSGGRLRAPLHPPLPAPGGEGCAKCASSRGTLLAEAVGAACTSLLPDLSGRPLVPGPWGLLVLTGPRCARGEGLLAAPAHKELVRPAASARAPCTSSCPCTPSAPLAL